MTRDETPGRQRAAPILVRAERSPPPSPLRHACLAPSVQVYLAPDGDVRACCRNWHPLGNVMETSLLDIWRGAAHRDVVARLARDDFSAGCQQCHAETVIEGRARAYPSNFDSFSDAVDTFGDEAGLPWPARIEFNLSNACNLMCIQCDGLLSSAIRAHRDHLPPLPHAYGEQFFSDIEHFIPHLTEAQFAGGEPFFAKENYRLWELVTRLNPELPCLVVTNATQWSRRIDDITDRVRMGYIFSIDAISKSTYEAIRVNARHEATMANVERYIAKARACEMPIEVNFCLMQQNYEELPEILLWAEERSIKVNVSVVRNPPECSLASLPAKELAAAVDHLERRDHEVRPHLGAWNRPTWDDELARLRSWRAAGPEARSDLYWESLPIRDQFGLIKGAATEDTADAREWVASLDPELDIHTLEVDEIDGDGDASVLTSVAPGFAEALDVEVDLLLGSPAIGLLDHLQQRHGALLGIDQAGEDTPRTDLELTFERARVRASAMRRPDGPGSSTTILVAICPT